ncbi:MAG: hypothetical protein HKN87_16825 [Saprospiraceae bacterium]|nr:hypothetical protein [Saprospiraceae bacterium]
MKNKINLVALIFLTFGVIHAQKSDITEGQVKYEEKLRDAALITVDIPKDEVKGGFNDFVRDHFNTNLKGYGFLARKDEVYTEFEEMPLLADQAIKLIGSFKERGSETQLYLLAQWEDNSFVSKKNQELTFQKLFDVARDFLEYYVPGYYAEKLEESNDAYENALSDVEKVKKELQKSKEDLRDLKRDIVEKESEISENENELKTRERTMMKKKEELEEEKERHSDAQERLSAILRSR